MLILFGCSWPANILKSVRSRTTLGKSLAFEILVAIGYVFGITAKIIIFQRTGALQVSFWFYLLDMLLVTTDICLYFRNLRIDKQMGRI
ncbi:MAG: hypothetical protein IJH90_02655 [Mogibacterium sp.]|nr:hypothetical protein [Mogibacterium sp.]